MPLSPPTLKKRILVIILAMTVMVGGLFAYRREHPSAYPDPVPPWLDSSPRSPASRRRDSNATSPSRSKCSGRQYPHVQAIRTISCSGLSGREGAVHIRRTIRGLAILINRLSKRRRYPNGVQAPPCRRQPIGELFRYRSSGPPGYTALILKTIQDWCPADAAQARSPGVIDRPHGWGGKTKDLRTSPSTSTDARYGPT